MPRTAWLRRGRVWSAAAGALLLSTMAPASASAYVFTLVGDGSSQLLTWFRTGAVTQQAFSINGSIPLQTSTGLGTKSGGMLQLTQQPGLVKAVAMPVAFANSSGSSVEAWAAVSAREDVAGGLVPLEFRLDLEEGDPLIADLHILPRLVGTISMYSWPGSIAAALVQFQVSVSINSEVVSSDILNGYLEVSDGPDSNWVLSLPNGGANSVLVPGVPVGSVVTISLWAYVRGSAQGANSQVFPFSSYGEGSALEVIVRDANQVDVAADRPAGLELGIAPNPARGTARMQYSLPRASQVRLSIYDVTGRHVATPLDRVEEAGRHELAWDGQNGRGGTAPPGVYAVELLAGPERIVRRVVVLGQ